MRIGALEVVMVGIGLGVVWHRRHLVQLDRKERAREVAADRALWRRMPFV
jgi:hypothetical protein